MERNELEALVDRVWRRHSRRSVAIFVAMMGAALIGLAAIRTGAVDAALRRRTAEALVVCVSAFGVAGLAYMFVQIKRDCIAFGALCPRCHKHLYSRRWLLIGGAGIRETGQCPHCATQLITGAPAVQEPMRTKVVVQTLVAQVVIAGLIMVAVLILTARIAFLS